MMDPHTKFPFALKIVCLRTEEGRRHRCFCLLVQRKSKATIGSMDEWSLTCFSNICCCTKQSSDLLYDWLQAPGHFLTTNWNTLAISWVGELVKWLDGTRHTLEASCNARFFCVLWHRSTPSTGGTKPRSSSFVQHDAPAFCLHDRLHNFLRDDLWQRFQQSVRDRHLGADSGHFDFLVQFSLHYYAIFMHTAAACRMCTKNS